MSWEQKRIVISRELSLLEICEIRAKTPAELEIECFVHGRNVCIIFRPLPCLFKLFCRQETQTVAIALSHADGKLALWKKPDRVNSCLFLKMMTGTYIMKRKGFVHD